MIGIGALINLARGVVKKASNSITIMDLEEELKKDLFEGFTEDEKLTAKIKLKEAELELANIRNKPREYKSKIEKEIIELMEAKLKNKMEKLKHKEATQLDIAKTMIAMQKTSNDMKDYIAKMDKELDSRMKTFISDSDKKLRDTINTINSRLKNIDAQLSSVKEQNRVMLSDIRIERERINKMNNAIERLKENIDNNSIAIGETQQTVTKYRKIWIISYILTILLFGIGLWHFSIR